MNLSLIINIGLLQRQSLLQKNKNLPNSLLQRVLNYLNYKLTLHLKYHLQIYLCQFPILSLMLYSQIEQ